MRGRTDAPPQGIESASAEEANNGVRGENSAMLTELRIAGYRGFRDPQTIPLAPITLFVGPNSGGKTVLLESLLLLKQMAEAPDPAGPVPLQGPWVAVGPFERLVFGHRPDQPVRLGCSWDWRESIGPRTDLDVSLWEGLEGLIPDEAPQYHARSAGLDWDWHPTSAGQPYARIGVVTVSLDDKPWLRLVPPGLWDSGKRPHDWLALDYRQEFDAGHPPWWASWAMWGLEHGRSWLEEYFEQKPWLGEDDSEPTPPPPPSDRPAIDLEALKSAAAKIERPPERENPPEPPRWWPVPTFAPHHPFWREWIRLTAPARHRIARNFGELVRLVRTRPTLFEFAGALDQEADALKRIQQQVLRPSVRLLREWVLGWISHPLWDKDGPLVEWDLNRGLPRVRGVADHYSFLFRGVPVTPLLREFIFVQSFREGPAGEWYPFAPLPRVGPAVEAIGASLGALLRAAQVYGPHRSPPPPYAPLTESPSGPGVPLWNAILQDRGRLEAVNAALEQLGIAYRIRVATADLEGGPTLVAWRYVHRDTGQAFWPSQVGYGIGQIVPVVVGLHDPTPRLFLMQQPELHLHPAAQAGLGSLFAEAAARGHQLLIETHSEHLLLRLQRLIRHGQLSAQWVRVYYVDNEDGVSRVRALRLDARGEWVDAWPRGFFEEDFAERFGGPV
jgi:hypothetical protein